MPEFMQLMDNWKGFRPVGKNVVSQESAARFIDLMENRDGLLSHQHEFLVREVITTDSFPDLFGFDKAGAKAACIAYTGEGGNPWDCYVDCWETLLDCGLFLGCVSEDC